MVRSQILNTSHKQISFMGNSTLLQIVNPFQSKYKMLFIIFKQKNQTKMSLSTEKLQSSSSNVEIKVKCERSEEIYNGNSSLENISEGKWLDDENVKFAIFMTLNKDVFKSKQKRKAEKIFKNVSLFLQSRSPRQCRSHFQKLIKKFGTVFQIKKHYRDLIGHRKFDQILENYRIQMQTEKEDITPIRKEISVQTEVSEYSLWYPYSFKAYRNQFQAQLYYYLPANNSETMEKSQ